MSVSCGRVAWQDVRSMAERWLMIGIMAAKGMEAHFDNPVESIEIRSRGSLTQCALKPHDDEGARTLMLGSSVEAQSVSANDVIAG